VNTAESPKISVMLPVFNGEKYLDECVRSVLKQGMQDFEILVGDDCSKDASHRIIDNFSDSRIRYFCRKKNLGVAGNLNQLIKDANGELLHILCQDDILEENCLTEEAAFFKKYPDIGMSICKAIRIDERGNAFGKDVLKDMPDVIKPSLSVQLFFYYGCIAGSGSPVCVKKRTFDNVGLLDESFRVAHDYEMWVRICKSKNLGIIHKHLVRLRSHAGQQSRNPDSGLAGISESRRIRASILPRLPEKIRIHAKYYVKLRQNVLDTSYCMRCLASARFREFIRIVRIMGIADFTFGTLCWFLTFGNRFYKPRPKFIE